MNKWRLSESFQWIWLNEKKSDRPIYIVQACGSNLVVVSNSIPLSHVLKNYNKDHLEQENCKIRWILSLFISEMKRLEELVRPKV